MKLSHAIMLNGMTKPQGHGADSVVSIDSPCAIGGALQSIGKQVIDSCGLSQNYLLFANEWPLTLNNAFCPHCKHSEPIRDIIWHLNDKEHWTRQQIAEWVQIVEPQEPEQTIEELVESAEVVND